MIKSRSERTNTRVVLLGGREVIAEGVRRNFWADISHRCMAASWPAFSAGAALVFVAFNAVFASFYWIGNQPISNVPGGAYIGYLYFSIETLSTAGYGDMHPQTHYGHFIATVELFTGIFSMSLMTGVVAAQIVHARKSCDYHDIRFGRRYAISSISRTRVGSGLATAGSMRPFEV
ncbi:MAG TPA: ion channel [Bradyrhizobium sp.]|jgi:inward rectifier potassium channel